MRSRIVRLTAAKELLDTLRDRRTLFVALILPLLLYPALLLGLTQVIGATARNLDRDQQKILFDAEGAGEELWTLLRKNKLEPIDAVSADARLRAEIRADLALLDEEGEDADAVRARLRRALDQNEYDAAVVCEDGFGQLVGGDRQAEASVLYDPTDESSKVARGKIHRALEEYQEARRRDVIARHPEEEARLRFIQAPVRSRVREMASRSQKGAYSFAPLLGMLIVIMALTGAFYPAVDLAAGEKERGTLETLLVAPVTRTEVVMGKFFAIWLIAVVTALLNLFVMGITFSKVAGMVGTGGIAFDLPFSTMLAVTIILIPTSALFSAIALALSSFATSYKEGQHYMSPLFLVATPLAMVALLPNVQLGYALSLVPIANVVLLVKAMLLGGEAAGPALVATCAMVVYASIALYIAVAIFKRESVLFRTGSGRGFDAASFKASQQGLPREGLAFLLFFVVLALMFFLSGKVETTMGAVLAFLKAQIVAVLLPTVLFAWRARVNVRETFSLHRPRLRALPLVVLAAGATLVVVLAFQMAFVPRREPQGFEELVRLLAEVPPWLFVGMLAVLPPICEELLCRGFLLSAFRARFGVKMAVILSALLFGFLHLDVYRFPATFMAGLMLGYVCVRTGTVLYAILFHMVYNGLIAVSDHVPAVGRFLLGIGPVTAAGAAVLLALAIAGIEALARRDDAPVAEEPPAPPSLTQPDPDVHSPTESTTRP